MMRYSLLVLAITSVRTQVLETSGPYNPGFPQQQFPSSTQNGSQYRPNQQIPYGSFPVNGNDFNSSPQSSFYQDSIYNTDNYGENGNEVDPQNTATYYAGLDYEERYRCPPNWIRYREACYRFTKSPDRPRNDARKICQAYEADLASVNNPEEHGFIITSLMKLDPQKGSWYLGAHQQSPGHWVNDVDGSQLSGLENAFFADQQSTYTSYNLLPSDYLVYRFSHEQGRWGLGPTYLGPVDGTQYYHFICEGQTQRLHYLIEEQRSFTYGLDTYDPERIPRGPYFIKEPVDTIYDPFKNHPVQLICIAGGYPAPIYKWYREDYQVDSPVYTEIDPLVDTRFILSGGTLMIFNPDTDKDNVKYHCTATNKFGTIRSESVRLSFGFIREFNQKRPIENGKEYWGKVIYCDPPSYYPAVNFLWARNYFPNLVEEDKRVFVSHDGGLYFSALETIDRGNYSCNVMSRVSDAGRNGPFFSLFVYPNSDYQHLKFPNNFPKLFPEAAVVGQEVRLECVSFGYPVPSYNWTRKNDQIPRKARLSAYNRVLTITNVGVEDEGEYICDVRNDRAHIFNSVFLKVQAEPNFTIPLTDKHMDNKGELHWNCEAFGIPDVNYTWWKNGQKLSMKTLEPEDKDRYIIQDNVLIMKYLDPTRDPGMYQCEGKNQLKSSFSSGQLRVLSLKPSFKKRPLESETYGSEGGNVTLRCNPEAAPRPTFTWKKDNVVIGAGGKRFITEIGNLIIRQLSRDDEGVYTCVAKNQYGSDESRGRLLVLRAPRFLERLPPRITTQVGHVIFLHCNAEVDPVLDTAYLWNHNGIRMKEAADLYADKRITIDGGVLTIINVSLSDVGDYECIVKSAIGRISSHTQLRIEGPPGPAGGLQVQNIQRSQVTLEWTDSNSNGRPITGYIVTGRTHWNSTWTVLTEHVPNVGEIDRYNGRKRAVINTALMPWSVYEFRVQAVNVLGAGEPSAPSPQFSTPADKPYQAPSNVGGGGGKTGDLTITWSPLPQSLQNGPGIHYKIFWKRNGTEVDYQSLLIKKLRNIGSYVVHISPTYFYTPYDVKVQAFNEIGAGPESEPVTIYSAEDMPQVAPQLVFARSFNSTSLNVTWNPIDQSRERLRGKLIGHRLKYWKQANKEEDSIYYLSRTTRNWALIVGLEPDIYYFVKVMAFNSAGEGPESERYLERTFRKAPQKPPASVNVWAYNPTTVRVVWRYVQPTDEEEPLLGYKVRVWETDQDMSTANDTLIPVEHKLEAYVTNLAPGKTYHMRVLAYSNGGDGRMSSPAITFQMGDYHSDAYGYTARDSANVGSYAERAGFNVDSLCRLYTLGQELDQHVGPKYRNFNQYGERSASQGYGSVPQQSHPPVRYNGAYDTRRPAPESYTVESPHQVYQERSKYGIPVARGAFVPKIDLTRPIVDQRHPERIRDDRHFLIEERKRPAGPIVSNIPEKMVRYETWTSDSRIEQRMSQSAREQHELMNQPVYSYTSHKQLEAYQNEQKAKLFSSSSMYRQSHSQGPQRFPSNVYPGELHTRDVPTNEYHPHYLDRSLPLNNRHQVIQKTPTQIRDKDLHLHHLDPHSRVPAKSSVLSILRNSLETKQTGFLEAAKSVKPDIIVIDDIDDPVIDITDNDHVASFPKPLHNHLPNPASPSFGNHIQMPKAIDSIQRDSEYQHIENPEVKVKSPENDVASRIRTKAELKSMPPSQDNTMRAEIKQSFSLDNDKEAKLLPKSQKQHLFNQIREDLRLESVIKIEKPSEPIISEVKSEPMNIDEIERDAVLPIKTEVIENFEPQCIPEDLDWASTCDNFMEQLKTSTPKKKTLKRRVDSLENEKEPQSVQLQKIENTESTSHEPLSEIEQTIVSTIPTDVTIKQEPMDEITNEDVPVPSSLPETEVQKLENNQVSSKSNNPETSEIEKKLDSKKHDTEKTTKAKQKLKAKSSSTTPVKKDTKESKDKVPREAKEIKGKIVKEIKNNKEKVVKEKKEGKEKSVKESKESKEKVVIKTVIKEEQESTDDDEPLIKSKILKEKEESERLKYQLLKDFTEKSAYVKLECCDVDVNKNNRKSVDSLTKEKEEIKPIKGKLSRQLSRSKTKSLCIDNNKNEKQDVNSSSESDDDLCVASRLRIRKNIKGDENKSTPAVKTPAKSSPSKKFDNSSSASDRLTPIKKPGFGDGSDFHPGWEEELFRYKRSLRMPTRLIAIPRGRAGGPFMRGTGAFFSRGTTSLPDLDPVPLSPAPSSAQSAATDDLYTRLPDKLTIDSDLDSNSSYSAPNRLHYDSEASTSTITSSTKAKKNGSSIVDVLIKKCGRKEDSKRKTKDRDEKSPKIIPKSSNTSELLPTPSLGLVKNNIKGNLIAQKEKLEEDIFYLGAFRKETVTAHRNAFLNNTNGLLGATEEFTPVVLKSRTRTESRIIRQRATIKEVFGDERPASAPPTSCRDDNYSNEKEDLVVAKKEVEETKPKTKPKKIVKGKIIRRSSSIRDGLRSTKLLKRNDAKGRLMRMKKRNSIMLSLNNKRMKEMSSNKHKNENSPSNNVDDKNKPKEENGSPVSVEGGPEVKKRFRRLFGRRKFSSGFDYIRKKKKIIRRDDQIAKIRRPAVKPNPESVIDIQKEIKGWFINKSVGETHLHRAARLGYTDCVAYCLEKMEADPSAKDNAGFTPLHVAAAKGHVRIARLLLQYGANVSAAAQGGIRPLHEASENCHMEVMRLLLSYGADPLLGTYAGQTPEELSEGSAAKLLQLHIADVQGRGVEPWAYPPPAVLLDKDELGCDPLCSPPPASPLPPPDSMMEIQCTEAPLPPFYSLRTAPGQPADGLWCLLQDITNLLQIKSKDSLLKQIHCGSGSPKELLREIRTQEFLERAQCNQLLGAGEKVNVRASKVALVRVTDKLRQLLKIETVLIS